MTIVKEQIRQMPIMKSKQQSETAIMTNANPKNTNLENENI